MYVENNIYYVDWEMIFFLLENDKYVVKGVYWCILYLFKINLKDFLGEKNNLIFILLNILKLCKVYCKIIFLFEICDYIFFYYLKILLFNFKEVLI